MTKVITDPDYAERMLRAAIGGEPELSDNHMADLMALATSKSEDDEDIFTELDLNRAASLGWQWKSGLTANQYDLGGGQGKTLDRSQWFNHCMRLAAGFADGTFSVLGSHTVAGSPSPKGIGVIGLTTSLGRGVDY